LLLSVGEQTVELIGGGCFVGDLENIVVEGFWVLDGRGEGVEFVVQLGVKVVLLQAELPKGPGQSRIVHHPFSSRLSKIERAKAGEGGDSEREGERGGIERGNQDQEP
jgi:hypothetical protein